MPKVSVIIPVYNVEKYLKQCVDSVLNQSFSDFEVILVDDGSPDGCPRICDEYAEKDSRVKVVHKENGGLSSARNAGFLCADGEYIWFVDSDDYLVDNAFQLVKDYIYNDNDIISFRFLSLSVDGKLDYSRKISTGTFDKSGIDELVQTACSRRLYTYVWRNIYRKDFLEKNNLSFVNGLSFAEDSAFNSKAFLLAEKITFADIFPYVYRDRTDGISKNVSTVFDEKIIDYFVEYDRIRDENYEKYCLKHSDTYYEDAGKFILTNIYFSSILNRIYNSRNKNKLHLFRKVSKSQMIKKALKRFDINKIKSNSLDWWMLWAVKHKMYFAGHLICRYILYK